MLLGKIFGRLSTHKFKFEVKGNAKKFDYVQVLHPSGDYVLGQIVEIECEKNKIIAYCSIIGYRDKKGILRGLNTPFKPDTNVLMASDNFVKEILGLDTKKIGAFFGTLDGRDKLKVFLDLNKMLTKHLFVTAKTGAGKSYTVGVILEELLKNRVPVVIIDPHGEYNSLKYPNMKEKERLTGFGLKPQGFLKNIIEYSPDLESNSEAKPLKLSNMNFSPAELMHLLPAKLSNTQKGVLYSALKNIGKNADFNEIIFEIETAEDNPAKWTLINVLEYLKKLKLFSDAPTLMSELVQPGTASIINLKGVSPDVQEVIVYKLVNDLFMERKKGNISPFFLIVEEAQLFCPERSFGETKCSSILRQIASEGRKFGLGMAIITQRPARVDKNVISQAGTQVVLKITNPLDLKAISNSIEGITSETEKEIKNIPIGTALVTGIVDLPLFVNIRPRKTKHGGEAVNILSLNSEEDNLVETEKDFVDGDIMLVIKQKITKKDREIMSESDKKLKRLLIPCIYAKCEQNDKEFNILIDLVNGKIINDLETLNGLSLNFPLDNLSPQQSRVLKIALKLKSFKPADLFAKSGVQFSELYDIIMILTNKNYLQKNNGIYELKGPVNSFANLEDFAFYHKPEYHKMSYDNMYDEKHSQEKIKEILSKFLIIKDIKKCWLEAFNS